MSTVIPLRRTPSVRDTIIREIKAWMGRRDVNQTQLAEHLHVSQSQLSKRLRGAITIDVDELENIADFLNIDPVVLLRPSVVPWPDGGGDDDPGRPSPRVVQERLDQAAMRHQGRGLGASDTSQRYAA